MALFLLVWSKFLAWKIGLHFEKCTFPHKQSFPPYFSPHMNRASRYSIGKIFFSLIDRSPYCLYSPLPPQRTVYREVPSQMAAHLRTGSRLWAGEIAGFGPRTAVSQSGVTTNEPPLLLLGIVPPPPHIPHSCLGRFKPHPANSPSGDGFWVGFLTSFCFHHKPHPRWWISKLISLGNTSSCLFTAKYCIRTSTLST